MRWVEEVSTIAARRVSPNVSWASAGIDSLTFKVSALPGWVVYVRVAVLKVYHSSVEIAAVVTCGALVLLLLWLACFADIGVPDDCELHAEDRNSHTPGIKHVSESFFTMVSLPRCSRKPPPPSSFVAMRVWAPVRFELTTRAPGCRRSGYGPSAQGSSSTSPPSVRSHHGNGSVGRKAARGSLAREAGSAEVWEGTPLLAIRLSSDSCTVLPCTECTHEVSTSDAMQVKMVTRSMRRE